MANVTKQGQFWDRVTEQVQPLAEARQLIESLIPTEQIRGSDVLDAGCGAGDFSAALAQIGARAVGGMDISPGSLRLAQAKTPSATFALGSLTELPYRTASYDVIWSWGVLHYVPDTQSALQEIARVLRPGGVALIHTLRTGFLSSLEVSTARVFSRGPRWLEPLVLNVGERVVPPVMSLMTGRRPEEHTSKSVRQKLHEMLYVQKTFTFDQIASGLGTGVQATEVHPNIPTLIKHETSITVMVRKHG